MADNTEDDGEVKPCLLDRWLSEAHQPQDLPSNPEVYDKIIGDTAESVGDKLVDLLYEAIKGDCGYSLFQKLRGIHIAMAGQLGLVEEWMRTEIRRNMAHINPEIVDIEREKVLEAGGEHVRRHIELGVIGTGEGDEDDEDEDDEPMVH